MGIKLVNQLCLGLSHLGEHKSKQSFQDTLNPHYNCWMDVVTSTHFLLQCPSYVHSSRILMSNLKRINPQISQTSLQICTLLFGNSFYSDKTNTQILEPSWLHPINQKVCWATLLKNAFLFFVGKWKCKQNLVE